MKQKPGPSVLQRRIKTDPVSKRLIKRKSRLCIAGNRQKDIQQATGTYQPRQTYADAADDLLIKTVIADSAGSPRRSAKKRVKIDIGNAYGRGNRKRPSAYMLLGRSLRRVDESAVELCVELNTPHYGEEPSGDEWTCTLDVDTRVVGWQQAEAVPALYYFLVPGGGRATLIRVVDDILLTYPVEARSVAENTIAKFNEFYDNDVSVCWDPDSFVGYAIIDDPVTGAVTLNMASHIEHAVRQYVPALLADPPQRPSASLQKGESFKSLADSMRHTPAKAPLLPSQTQVQRIVGALRYPEKVLPILTLGLRSSLATDLHF
ncbi:hypothetical protein AB1Y20_018895 [Prymnesium parvum]|uniref:Uncharacterized protein n=1 Tax=Prymnesium parvum TaxID=97485 RepID=A0AB34JPY3_PRYPA